MHIPDGFIDGKTAATTAALSVAGLGLALRRVRHELPRRKVPLLGLAAAFVFAAQMINFPVAGGTSGHLMGGVLIAALLGPSAAIVVLTSVLIVQCFLFADGGVTALGANLFNMGLAAGVAGWCVYKALSSLIPGRRGRVTAVAFAGWCSTVLAAICCAGELAWSRTVSPAPALAAMTSVHIFIGIGEGLISALVLLAIERSRPDLLNDSSQVRLTSSAGSFVGYGILATIGIVLFLTPFASSWPDGLEAVAAKLGFEHRATSQILTAPLADYQFAGINWTPAATALAGLAGALVVFAFAWILGRALVRSEPVIATGVSKTR